MKRYLPVRIFFSVLLTAGLVWFFIPVLHTVLNIGNLTGMAVCLFLLLACILYPQIKKKCRSSKSVRILCRIVSVFILAGLLWTVILTILIFSGSQNKPPETATVVVLGSQVSGHYPSADLMARINAAGDYLSAHPKSRCIVSGGRGIRELETEASVMKRYLLKRGIDASRITEEDRSANTQENLKYSLGIVDKNKMSRDLAIVTDEYHQYRAGRIAKGLGSVPYSVCATTPWYIFSACYARELLALTKYLILP